MPPWRSTCNIRRIWRKRMPLRRRSLCPHRACPRSPQGEQPAHPHAPLTPLAPPPVRLHALPAPRPPSAPSAQFTDEQTEAPGQAGHSLGPGSERELAQSPPPSTLPQGPSTAGGGGACACACAYLIAEVANTCPLEPTQRTTMEATTTMRSEGQQVTTVTSLAAGSGGRAWRREGTEPHGGTQGTVDGRPGPISGTCRATRSPPPPRRPRGRQTAAAAGLTVPSTSVPAVL